MTTEGSPSPEPRRPIDYRFIFRGGLVVLLLGVFVIFGLQNAEPAEVEFLWWTFEIRRIIVLIGSAIAGIIIWELGGFVLRRRRRTDAIDR
jgi:uncharacterized integral membrane protein